MRLFNFRRPTFFVILLPLIIILFLSVGVSADIHFVNPVPFDQLTSPYLFIDEAAGKYSLVVIDTKADQVFNRTELIGRFGTVIGDIHKSPDGSYYFLDSGYQANSKDRYGEASVAVLEPSSGRIATQFSIPSRTDMMSNITSSNKFLAVRNGWTTGKGVEFVLINTNNHQIEKFYQKTGPGKTSYPWRAYLAGHHTIESSSEQYIYLTLDTSPPAALYRLDPYNKELTRLHLWERLTYNPAKIGFGQNFLYAAVYPALDQIVGEDKTPLEIQILDKKTGKLERHLPMPSVEKLFGWEGSRSDVYISWVQYDKAKEILYLNLHIYHPFKGSSVVSCDVNTHTNQFNRIAAWRNKGFNEMQVINSDLYLRQMNFKGHDEVLRLDPKTGDKKWIIVNKR